MAATIAHELNQPLAAIVSNGSAGLRWLDRPEPNLEEARLAFGRVVNEGHRAAQIITSIRTMFRKDSGARSPVAINELVCDVVSTSLGELKRRRVSLALELLDDLPGSGRSCAASAGAFEPPHKHKQLYGLHHRSSSHALCAFRASRGLDPCKCPNLSDGDQSRAR